MASQPMRGSAPEEFHQQYAFVHTTLPRLVFAEAMPGARMMLRLAERGERSIREFLRDAWEDTARMHGWPPRSPGGLAGRPAGPGLVLVTLPHWHDQESFALVAVLRGGVRYFVARPQPEPESPASIGLYEQEAHGAPAHLGRIDAGEFAFLTAVRALLTER